jgi:hypothetical protein
MKNKCLFITILLLSQTLFAVAQIGFEQYYYGQKNKPTTLVPIVHFQNKRNWYGEARFNYEEASCFSLYVGKNFYKERDRFSYSFTPIAGAVMGKYQGASAGILANLEFGGLFFSSQSQLTFSRSAENEDFVFSWAELGYQPFKWLFAGLSIQHTYYIGNGSPSVDAGTMIGFNIGKLSFPVYCFNILSNDRYFVVGINLDITTRKTNSAL